MFIKQTSKRIDSMYDIIPWDVKTQNINSLINRIYSDNKNRNVIL